MKDNHKTYINWLYPLMMIVLTGLLLILITGAARAHLEEAQKAEVYLRYETSAGMLCLLGADEDALGTWESVTDKDGVVIPHMYSLKFRLSNGTGKDDCSAYDQEASLALFATAGIEDPEDIKVVLTDGRSTCTAVPSRVPDGSVWYNTYGPGWLYQFYTDAGEELTWHLAGGVFVDREMKLTVEGTSEHPATFSLIASSKPGTN